MSLRLLGGALLALAGFGAGSLLVRRLDGRRRFFASFLSFVNLLATRLRFSGEDIYRTVNLSAAEAGLKAFAVDAALPFSQAWEAAVAALRLREEDTSLLCEFGSQLGKTDLEGQLSHLALYETIVQKRLHACEEEYAQKSRVYRAVGLFAGTAAALLLI